MTLRPQRWTACAGGPRIFPSHLIQRSTMTKISSLALAGVAFAGLALSASADSLDRTGSLLLNPLFDNNRGGIYTITVTNTNNDTTPLPSGLLLAGTVDVEFVYINGSDCLE